MQGNVLAHGHYTYFYVLIGAYYPKKMFSEEATFGNNLKVFEILFQVLANYFRAHARSRPLQNVPFPS